MVPLNPRDARRTRWIGRLVFLVSLAYPLAAQTELLTLEEAVRLALANNRSVEQASLSAKQSEDAISIAKTQRLPSFRFATTAGMLLTQPTITFDKGAFGEYPGIGPIPGNTTHISTPRKPTALLSGEVLLPLTPQRRIRLNIQSLELGRKIADQQTRLTQLEVVKEVRQTYYAILQSQSSLEAVEYSLELLRELAQQTSHYVKVGTALDADLLQIKARLAQAEYDKAALAGPLATQKEQLNLLLGRSIQTDFRVAAAVEASWIPALAEARERAIVTRPEIEQARLKVQQAYIDRNKKRTEYIPDISASLSYTSALNMTSAMPRNVAIAGVQASWEPFDWGRKRSELAQKSKVIQDAELTVKDVEDRIRIEVGSAHRKMQESRVLLAASRAAQESARETARLAGVRYRASAALLNAVLEAQADLASANDRTQKALLAYWSARADLEKAMGGEQ